MYYYYLLLQIMKKFISLVSGMGKIMCFFSYSAILPSISENPPYYCYILLPKNCSSNLKLLKIFLQSRVVK